MNWEKLLRCSLLIVMHLQIYTHAHGQNIKFQTLRDLSNEHSIEIGLPPNYKKVTSFVQPMSFWPIDSLNIFFKERIMMQDFLKFKKPNYLPSFKSQNGIYVFTHCNLFSRNPDNLPERINEDFFRFSSIRFVYTNIWSELRLENLTGYRIDFLSTNIHSFFSSNVRADIYFQDVLCNEKVTINKLNGRLHFTNVFSLKDTFDCLVRGSTIAFSSHEENSSNIRIYRFLEDTLVSHFNFTEFKTPNQPTHMSFIGCHINCPISIRGVDKNSTFEFTECSFGPHARIDGINGQRVTFSSCADFARPLVINFDKVLASDKKPIYFLIDKTDVDQLDFEYLGNINLNLFADEPNQFHSDNNTSLYERLLRKYERTGQKSSYQNLDIEYKQYNYNSEGSYFQNSFEKNFWNYGYSKHLVIPWVLIILSFFALINGSLARKSFGKLYPLRYAGYKKYFFSNKHNFLAAIDYPIRVHLFTLILFFSFKLNFEKLRKEKSLFIFWIIIQYLTGFAFLLFLFNSVLKISFN